MSCCREAFPEPSQLSTGLFYRNIVCHREQQGTAGSEPDSHLKLPPSQILLLAHPAPRLRNQQLLHRLEKPQGFANAAVGSTSLVWQRFMHFPNVTIQNLRLCNTTKLCLWELLLLWHLYCHTCYFSIILTFTCSSLTQPTVLNPSH